MGGGRGGGVYGGAGKIGVESKKEPTERKLGGFDNRLIAAGRWVSINWHCQLYPAKSVMQPGPVKSDEGPHE